MTLWSFALPTYSNTSSISSLIIPESLSFEMVDGLMVLKVPNGSASQQFLFDTGAEEIIINQKVDQGSFEILSVNRSLKADQISINHLELGSTVLNSLDAWAVDLGFLETQIGQQLDGIIGAQLLVDNSVMIDYETSTITFVPHGANFSTIGKNFNVVALDYKQDQYDLPVIDITLEGKPLKLGFDTGANICVFDQKHRTLLSSNTTAKPDYFSLSKLHIQQCKLNNVPYLLEDFGELNKNRTQKIDGLISADALSTEKIFIDSERRKIFLLWDKSV